MVPKKKPEKKRGRPPKAKPNDEQLRPSVLDECRRELLARRLQMLERTWDEVDMVEWQTKLDILTTEILPRRTFMRVWREQDQLSAAYRQLLAALDVYSETRHLIDSDALDKGAEFLQRVTGQLHVLESPYRAHLEQLRPHLDALAAERDRMRKVIATEPPRSKHTPDSSRGYLLELLYDARERRQRDWLMFGRPLDVREVAMVSLLAGHWPTVKAGEVSVDAVIAREVLALRESAKRREIPLIEPPDRGADLCDTLIFGACRFFMTSGCCTQRVCSTRGLSRSLSVSTSRPSATATASPGLPENSG